MTLLAVCKHQRNSLTKHRQIPLIAQHLHPAILKLQRQPDVSAVDDIAACRSSRSR